MDVEKKDDLCDFVDALDGGDDQKHPTGVTCEDPPKTSHQWWPVVDEQSVSGWPATVDVHGESCCSDPRSTSSDAWKDLSNVFDNWLCCLIGTENRILTPGKSLKSDRINQTIDGMLEDGLIGFSGAHELRFVGNLWLRLMNAHTLYTAGCITYRHDIITLLFELFAARQIAKELCITICSQL